VATPLPTHHANGHRKPGQARCRRRGRRCPPDPCIACEVEWCDGQVGQPAKVLNLALGGAGLIVQHAVAPGTPVTIMLTNALGLFTTRLGAVVRNLHVLPDGTYLLGCELALMLTGGQLWALVAQASPTSFREVR
jgi:hypothetical protein